MNRKQRRERKFGVIRGGKAPQPRNIDRRPIGSEADVLVMMNEQVAACEPSQCIFLCGRGSDIEQMFAFVVGQPQTLPEDVERDCGIVDVVLLVGRLRHLASEAVTKQSTGAAQFAEAAAGAADTIEHCFANLPAAHRLVVRVRDGWLKCDAWPVAGVPLSTSREPIN